MLARVNRGALDGTVCPLLEAWGADELGLVPTGVALVHAVRMVHPVATSTAKPRSMAIFGVGIHGLNARLLVWFRAA